MEKFVTLRLPQNYVYQIIDDLTERIQSWKATEEYLGMGFSLHGDFIEDCSCPEEAGFRSQHYETIKKLIQNQLESQNAINA